MMQEIIKNARENQRRKNSYRDESGLLRCRDCGQPLEAFVEAMGEVLPVVCACDTQAEEAQKLAEQLAKAERIAKASPLYDAGYNDYTFERDAAPGSPASRQSRAYVEHWPEMEKENFGLLFAGPLGVGKSYYAAAIINALRAKGVSALIVTTSRFINTVRSAKDPQEIIDGLNKFHLVALDDLGAERDTGYAVEQLENFVNVRSLRKKPLIVTTNMLHNDPDSPTGMPYARIFDRIKEMCCHRIILTGPSKRGEREKERAKRCRAILGRGCDT